MYQTDAVLSSRITSPFKFADPLTDPPHDWNSHAVADGFVPRAV
jgi:hypothetical protein